MFVQRFAQAIIHLGELAAATFFPIAGFAVHNVKDRRIILYTHHLAAQRRVLILRRARDLARARIYRRHGLS